MNKFIIYIVQSIKNQSSIINSKNKCNSINITKYNRSEIKNNKNNKNIFEIRKKQINKKNIFNKKKEESKNKIRNILNKIKIIEEQNLKKYQSSSKSNTLSRNIKEAKSNILSHKNDVKSSNNNIKNYNVCDTALKTKKFDRNKNNNQITINNNYYTIINNMTLNDINDAKKISDKINFVKMDEHCHNFNNSNYLSNSFKKESGDIFLINQNLLNNKTRSRNQSNFHDNCKIKSKFNISLHKNNNNFKSDFSYNKNKLNNSYINNKNKLNNSKIKNKKSNIKLQENKKISLKERIHLFHQKREAIVKQNLDKNIKRKSNEY